MTIQQSPGQHPQWCDQEVCSADHEPLPYYTHCSSPFQGTYDPVTDTSIDVTVLEFLGKDTHVMFEFQNDECEGHEVTPHQASELVAALSRFLAQIGPNGPEGS